MCGVMCDCREESPPEKGPLSQHLEEVGAGVLADLGDRVPAERGSPACPCL